MEPEEITYLKKKLKNEGYHSYKHAPNWMLYVRKIFRWGMEYGAKAEREKLACCCCCKWWRTDDDNPYNYYTCCNPDSYHYKDVLGSQEKCSHFTPREGE